jgi:hypothetical protein
MFELTLAFFLDMMKLTYVVTVTEDPILKCAADTLQQDEPNVNSVEKQTGTLQIIDRLEEAAECGCLTENKIFRTFEQGLTTY